MSSWVVLALFSALYLASQIAIAVTAQPLGVDMLLVQTSLSASHVREIFNTWQVNGLLATYAAHYRYDMIHPLWYSVALAAALAKGMERTNAPASRNALLLAPFVAGICDLIENIVHLRFLADRNAITTGAVLLGNGAAWIKWILAVTSIVAIVRFARVANRKSARARRSAMDPEAF